MWQIVDNIILMVIVSFVERCVTAWDFHSISRGTVFLVSKTFYFTRYNANTYDANFISTDNLKPGG